MSAPRPLPVRTLWRLDAIQAQADEIFAMIWGCIENKNGRAMPCAGEDGESGVTNIEVSEYDEEAISIVCEELDEKGWKYKIVKESGNWTLEIEINLK